LRLVRFGIVGVSNTLITLAVFAMLHHHGVPGALASALGFAAGAANGYRLNRTWTFRSAASGSDVVARYVGIELVVVPVVMVLNFALTRRVFA
jgi:putative flippase GtrA